MENRPQLAPSGAVLRLALLLTSTLGGLAPIVSAWAESPVPRNAPAYFGPTYQSAIKAPLPALTAAPSPGIQAPAPATTKSNVAVYNSGGFPTSVPNAEVDSDPIGSFETYQPGGATTTATNAFFQSLGQNGRSCATCHQPPSGMSVSLSNIKARRQKTNGTDPIFAPVDGANCPSAAANGKPFAAAHSLLLTKGLFRIFLPVPTQTQDNPPQPVEFTISVLSDPTGCNTDPTYNSVTDPNTGAVTQIVSVFRRPTIATNLGFKTTTLVSNPNSGFPPTDPVTGIPLGVDSNGVVESGNIMWDGREPTLESQAIDATLGHAQATHAPTTAQVNQMVAFELGLFSAQTGDKTGLASGISLTANTQGGPVALSGIAPAGGGIGAPAFTLFDAWSDDVKASAQDRLRESIYRGQTIFNTRPFSVNNVAGFNNIPNVIPNPAPGSTCATCHSQLNAGSDLFPAAQQDVGIGGDEQALGGPGPSSDLPIFQVTCINGTQTAFGQTSVVTNDPGAALITGRCADVGRFTVPQLRALASHPPYFTDGSAATLTDVVNFYNTRFSIGLSSQDITDLVNFLNAL